MFKKKEGKSCFKPGKCLHCVDFIRSSKVQKVHSVFKHYPQGKSMALEDRPIDIYTNGGIKIYEINSTEHADHYERRFAKRSFWPVGCYKKWFRLRSCLSAFWKTVFSNQ